MLDFVMAFLQILQVSGDINKDEDRRSIVQQTIAKYGDIHILVSFLFKYLIYKEGFCVHLTNCEKNDIMDIQTTI